MGRFSKTKKVEDPAQEDPALEDGDAEVDEEDETDEEGNPTPGAVEAKADRAERQHHLQGQAIATARHLEAGMVAGGAMGVPAAMLMPGMMRQEPIATHLPNYAGHKPRRYRVVLGGPVMSGGLRNVLRAGKELDDRHYNIAQLIGQGVQLQEIEAVGPEIEVTDDPTTRQRKAAQALGPRRF
jgi:hypothetical protein